MEKPGSTGGRDSGRRRLSILMVDDEDIVHTTVGGYLRDLGHAVDDAYDGEDGLRRIEAGDYDIALVDVRMPGMDGLALLARAQAIRPDLSCVIVTAHAEMEVAIGALRMGAVDFLIKPVKLLELDAVLEKAVRVQQLRRDRRRLRDTLGAVQEEIDLSARGREYVGVSPATQQVREQVRAAVEAECDTILITGETGTGKEVVAREIHFQAENAASPFIAVSCPALPDTLVESELFGHTKGAFTGATTDRAGYFEMADGGTLFLDEVGELSASAQAVFLRVLETRTFRRVGGTKEASVSVRVVAATNADLDRAVEFGEFRRDLLHRLNVFPIHLLPLRERRGDIVPLAGHFLAAYGATRGLCYQGFSPEAIEVLTGYDYPGNARELRNIVDRAAILGRGAELIQAEHLSLSGIQRRSDSRPTGEPQAEEARERILAALQECKWNRRKAAQRLGMPYSTLRYRIDKLGIGKD